jgi:guanylate kinase
LNKIIVICGFSAAGKDKITQYIADKYNYQMIISTTSRPMRPNESEDNPYHFVTRQQLEEMNANGEFIECRTYHTLVNNVPDTWYYGVHKDSVDLTKHSYIVVLDILGLREIKKHFPDNILSFFIFVDEETRRNRCIDRADFDPVEWKRRAEDDNLQFEINVVNQEVDYIVNNYNFDECVKEIMEWVDYNKCVK